TDDRHRTVWLETLCLLSIVDPNSGVASKAPEQLIAMVDRVRRSSNHRLWCSVVERTAKHADAGLCSEIVQSVLALAATALSWISRGHEPFESLVDGAVIARTLAAAAEGAGGVGAKEVEALERLGERFPDALAVLSRPKIKASDEAKHRAEMSITRALV